MEAILFAAAIVCVAIGYVAARVEFQQKINSAKEKSYQAGIRRGEDTALFDPERVAKAHRYHTNLK